MISLFLFFTLSTTWLELRTHDYDQKHQLDFHHSAARASRFLKARMRVSEPGCDITHPDHNWNMRVHINQLTIFVGNITPLWPILSWPNFGWRTNNDSNNRRCHVCWAPPFFIDSLPPAVWKEASASPLLATHAPSPQPTLLSLRLWAIQLAPMSEPLISLA